VNVHHRFQWLYVVAFVHPESGRSLWYLLPVLNTSAFQAVLENFASSVLKPSQQGCSKRVLLVLDRAGWHTSQDLRVPDGIELVFQPAYSPEVQPAERLWGLTDEVLANQCFRSLSSLTVRLSEQCVRLMVDVQRVRAATLFWWWPRITVS
jgi:transposase